MLQKSLPARVCDTSLFLSVLRVYYYQAQFVPQEDPSLQEQYEYASDHDIKCLVFITEAGVSQTELVKVNTLTLCYRCICALHCQEVIILTNRLKNRGNVLCIPYCHAFTYLSNALLLSSEYKPF